MNLLTQFLLKELLGEQKTVAIYGGGFKPPTKGHFTVAQETLKELPNIDELKIFVGGGVRDGITQNESVQIWKIYQPYLSDKIEVEPVSSPVKAVLDYAKENPDEKVYWILGARDGDEGDLADIENRTKSLSKYPNLEVKVITTSGGISGTKTRQAVRDNNKELFLSLIPDVDNIEQDQIWDLVSPVIKEDIVDNIKNYILAVDKVEDLQEGRKNKPEPEKGTGKKPEGSSRRLYTDEDPKDTVGISFKTKEDIVDTLNKKSFKAKSHARQSQIINVIHQRVRAAYNRAKDPETKARLKRGLDYIEKRREMSKKKTERLRKMKEASDPQAGTALPYGSGFAPVKENDLFGLNELAKDFVKEVFDKAWNFKEGMLSLSKYMIDNGMNIKPLPKIKVIKDDEENASNLLGKTAYYNPNEKSITLYTMNRHPKDILRSFAHEMIHHEQNLNGKLNNITTQNTNEDGDLPEIEREAYEKGNMMLRNWEDSIKNV